MSNPANYPPAASYDATVPMSDWKTPPTFGLPTPAEAGGELPRVVTDRTRAIPGTVRVKLRCTNFTIGTSASVHRYFLTRPGAEGIDAAKKLFLDVSGVAKEVQRQKSRGMELVEEPEFAVTVLPD